MPNQWKQKRSSIRHYDRTAPTYDTQYGEEQDTKIAAALENLPLLRDAVILDAGCGTGLLFSHIAEKARLIVGVDTSLRLLQRAKIKAIRNTYIIRADADQQPFKADTFTHAFALTLIQNTPNPNKTLEEIKRVTQPNATIIITGLKKHFTQEEFNQLLINARLEILSLKTDQKLKDHVAICTKHL